MHSTSCLIPSYTETISSWVLLGEEGDNVNHILPTPRGARLSCCGAPGVCSGWCRARGSVRGRQGRSGFPSWKHRDQSRHGPSLAQRQAPRVLSTLGSGSSESLLLDENQMWKPRLAGSAPSQATGPDGVGGSPGLSGWSSLLMSL